MSTTYLSAGEVTASDVWTYAVGDRALTFTEVSDSQIAAGASSTPLASGIFSCMCEDASIIVEIYSDSNTAWEDAGVGSGQNFNAIVGEASKIRFRNSAGAAKHTVVNRYG